MTREDAIDIVGMIVTNWQVKNWTKEEMDAYARNIQHLDAEIVTSVVVRASREIAYPPKVAELHERYRAEKRRLRPEVAPIEQSGAPLEFWVKRWCCARFFYDDFGKERDMRRFVEQGDHGDLTQELMPEGAWVEEAELLNDEEAIKKWRARMSTS